MNNQWFSQNNITSPKEIFMYQSWWKHQATKMHKKNPMKVKPSKIKVSKKSIIQEIETFLDQENVEALQNILGPDAFTRKFYSNENMPGYLLSEEDIKNGFYNSLDDMEPQSIDYTKLKLPVDKLDGMVIGDYTIRLPKTTHEVVRGGRLMGNCMGCLGAKYLREFIANPKEYYNYLDAHVIKDNKLVGGIALEKILKGEARFCHYGFFINECNTGNQDMEKLLTPLFNEVLGTNFPTITVPAKKNKPIETSPHYKKIGAATEELINWEEIFLSKK